MKTTDKITTALTAMHQAGLIVRNATGQYMLDVEQMAAARKEAGVTFQQFERWRTIELGTKPAARKSTVAYDLWTAENEARGAMKRLASRNSLPKPTTAMKHSIRLTGPDGAHAYLTHRGKVAFAPSTARKHLAQWMAHNPGGIARIENQFCDPILPRTRANTEKKQP